MKAVIPVALLALPLLTIAELAQAHHDHSDNHNIKVSVNLIAGEISGGYNFPPEGSVP